MRCLRLRSRRTISPRKTGGSSRAPVEPDKSEVEVGSAVAVGCGVGKIAAVTKTAVRRVFTWRD